MSSDSEVDFPCGSSDERELFLGWLRFLRGAVIRKVEDLSDVQARWRPDGALISLLGIINHLTHVEWRSRSCREPCVRVGALRHHANSDFGDVVR
jgi:hypothetical protein